MRAASSICKRRSHNKRCAFSISSNSRTPRWCRERTFPSRPGLPVSSPMNSLTLSRCRNSDISKRMNILGSEQIAGEFQRQLRLPHSGRPEKQERPERFPGGLQSKLAAFQNRAHAGNDMVLPFDPGKQVSFEAIQVFDRGRICVHEWLAGLDTANFSHCRTA